MLILTILISFFTLYSNPLNAKQKLFIEPPTDNEIVFGQSAFLSGHLGLYGKTIKKGIETYFSHINKLGGIRGKKLRLISLDDQGRPEKTLKNIEQLQKLGVTMFLGCTGTRSIMAALPLIKQEKIAMFFPWGGDEKFRDKNLKNMINGLGFLSPQIDALAKELINTRKITKIAVFHADDDFSSNAAEEFKNILKKHGLSIIKSAAYNRHTVDIKRTSKELINADPKLVVCIGTSIPTVRIINNFLEKGYYGTSFIGVDSTLFVNRILKTRGIPFTFTSSVPDPITSKLAIVDEYRKNIDLYAPTETYNILSLAYYISAAIIVQAMQDCGPNEEITQQAIISNIEKMKDKSINDYNVTFDSTDRHIFGKNIEIIKG